MRYWKPLRDTSLKDIGEVGGKNASTGELIHTLTGYGIRVPDGFAVTTAAYRRYLEYNNLQKALEAILKSLDVDHLSNLDEVGAQCRSLFLESKQPFLGLPQDVTEEISAAYDSSFGNDEISVAVRSSATAEDLPTLSFAGQHSSFLNIRGIESTLTAVVECYASMFTDRAIKYRVDNGIPHMDVSLSVGVQRMVRADVGSSGVIFTIDPETGFRNVVYITSCWGLGENIVQGAVIPDEFLVFADRANKPLEEKVYPIIRKQLGAKEYTMRFAKKSGANLMNGDSLLTTTENIETPHALRDVFSITDDDVQTLSAWCLRIEQHYNVPMDIEFAKDGLTGELYIVQARPETVQTHVHHDSYSEYKLLGKHSAVCVGKAVGRAIACGPARIIRSLADASRVKDGDVIVAEITNPDWNALLRRAVSIVTNRGGRTSHASIVARELGIHAVVGTGNATERLHDGQMVTVSCIEGDEGYIYDGRVEWKQTEVHFDSVPQTHVQPMLILADPGRSFHYSFLPSQGVGLLRMEFVITNSIRIHPMALAGFDQLPEGKDKASIAAIARLYKDKREFFVDQLSQAVAHVAAAFFPRPVIVRMSDFKTNEYAQLIGGTFFEPQEENPMLGFRGASRYYNDRYKAGFELECRAMKRVRDEMGFSNVKIMIPFCRTTAEGRNVLSTMKEFGLEQGKNGLEVYVMAEIPSNVVLAKEFSQLFDGFSIGSNDLTQLTLGIDRDSAVISDLFDENDEAVKFMLSKVISEAKLNHRHIGLCGQAPSDRPEFAQFLVHQGIDSISFTPDSLLRGIENIAKAEQLR